ncbi:hypothetical protein ABEF95_003145 [Exophiala dermatitidis]
MPATSDHDPPRRVTGRANTAAGAVSLPTHLIVVCCHAIYLGGRENQSRPTSVESNQQVLKDKDEESERNNNSKSHQYDSDNEANWLIEPFQKGETGTYIQHIEAGVRKLAEDDDAVLVFSGGATKTGKTAKSEGQGYLDVAIERNLFDLETSPPTLRPRMFVDQFATDSYQNVLFSIIQFHLFIRERYGAGLSLSSSCSTTNATDLPECRYPTKLTIISHRFKRSRFLDLHVPAMRWAGQTFFIGIDPPFDAEKMAEIEAGDRLRGYGVWEKDLYGAGELLSAKRKTRGWDLQRFRREVLERLASVEDRIKLEQLLFWNGGEDGRLRCPYKMPWEEN